MSDRPLTPEEQRRLLTLVRGRPEALLVDIQTAMMNQLIRIADELTALREILEAHLDEPREDGPRSPLIGEALRGLRDAEPAALGSPDEGGQDDDEEGFKDVI